MKEACENMPHCYQEYINLGNKNWANISFKESIYFQYVFFPKGVDEKYFKCIKSSIEEPSCSNSVSKEEERGSKGEESTKPYVGPIFMIFSWVFF